MKEKQLDEEGRVIRPNKSALKREQARIRQWVEALVTADEEDWRRLGLDAPLCDGLLHARRMKPSGARNRHIKYLARLLQAGDTEVVRVWVEERDRLQAEANRRLQRLEQWRERLVEEGDAALQAFLDAYPHADRQQLRQLLRNARRERDSGKPAGAGRKLFRLLREISAAGVGSATL